ncbi:flagellar hook capping FlgD N-terminal domain-containing protein [Sphaerotilus sp.]|uniref:flagellar hook assembly protein FlgD n=1 Tax=Sphaerotilus sp. TaxID=2093942 RepID=UPI00286E848D|nr:flagellar hook capping FlgD N-terminal domain-containing protein [Sphaerotilus sp.]
MATATTTTSKAADASSVYNQLKTGTSTTASKMQEASDQFLKLLVTQMQSQDPLNPMDNAQVTSQMAQINTVSGLGTVNESIKSMSAQLLQMQTMQGASLVGNSVVVPGNAIDVSSGSGVGHFELGSAADAVKVEVLSSAGKVVDTLDMGAETSGRHTFNWKPAEGLTDASGFRFRVTATSGTANVTTTTLMRDQVSAVSSTATGGLSLQLKSGGTVAYSDVRAFGG